ncbi:radical SAM protein [Sulfurimonas sp. HSL-1716]|uniref:radical SAM protein n=1 Tax=Hydrocurvibacter sulfurireducens TaxID=3131937 RepID=UPI0031F831D9
MANFDFDGHKLFYQYETSYKLLTDQAVDPVYVEYSPVGSCNHRCTFCAYDYIGYQSRRLDTQKTIASIKAFGKLGCKAMLFAGEGEPLIHPDIDDFIITCYDNKIDSAIYTNGVLFTPKRADKILDKLTFVRVSFNAGTKENYNEIHKSDDFEKVVENLKYAVKLKKEKNIQTDIGLQIVVIPENLHTIVDLAKIGREIGVDYLAIKPFVQHNDQEGYQFSKNFSLQEVESILDEAEQYSTKEYKVIARKEAFRKYHDRSYDHCLALPIFSVVLSDGNVYSCGPYLNNSDYCYGNIHEQSVEEIMHGDKRKKILDFAKNRLDCKGECMPNCRLDAINRSLWELKNPTLKHINFI